MKYLLIALALVLGTAAQGESKNDSSTDGVQLFYAAISRNDTALPDKIPRKDWVAIPAAPSQVPGLEGAKQLVSALTMAFPDLTITPQDVLQDGSKVIVRSELTGTHEQPFMGFPPKNRRMTIQVVDIHEFQDGKILRGQHTENWLTGRYQLGVFDK